MDGLEQASQPEAVESEVRQRGGLARNVLGLWDGVVLGFASAAPGVSIAGVLAGLAAASGHGALLALLIGFLPLVGIALGFYHLNRWRADVGISYAWIGRVLNPMVGAFVGVLILIAFIVSNSFSLIPAATNFLTIFSAKAATNNLLITLFGTLFLALITGLVVAGIRLAARFQWAISSVEMTVMFIFAVIALVHGLNLHSQGVKGPAVPTLHWFTPSAAGGSSGLVAGLLISVFWYSGWETAVVVNEETKRAHRNPGLAGIGGLAAVLVVSILLSIGFFTDVSPHAMNANSGWLTQTGLNLVGRPWGYILTIAILLGYLGGIETTIITFGHVGYSMGRDRVIWRAFAKVSDRTRMPWVAILVLTIPCLAMFLLQVWASGNSIATILSNLSSSIGLMFVVYYALTGIASAWLMRKVKAAGLRARITGMLLPLLGSATLIWIGVKSWGQSTGAVRITWLVAIGVSAVGILISRVVGRSPFYRPLSKQPDAQATEP